MSDASDLLVLATDLVGGARPGEAVEVYAARSRDTDIKVFGGEVESLSVAEVSGVGVRVVADGRVGYAWAGSLDVDVVAETLAEARDNVAFSAVDDHAGVATPDDAAGVEPVPLDLWRAALLSV